MAASTHELLLLRDLGLSFNACFYNKLWNNNCYDLYSCGVGVCMALHPYM